MGRAIPSEQTPAVDFETQSDFDFIYDIALQPKVDADWSKITIPFYTIRAAPQDRQDRAERLRLEFGSPRELETATGSDFLMFVDVAQSAEGGVSVENALLSPQAMPPEQAALLQGRRTGDSFEVNLQEMLPNDADRAAFLHLKKKDLARIAPAATLAVRRITRTEPADLNQEFFDKIYGTGAVTTEAQFWERIDADLRANLAQTSNYLFASQARRILVEQVDLPLAEGTLKRWLKLSSRNEGSPIPDDTLENEAQRMFEEVRWRLIADHIAEQNNIDVTEDEVAEYFREMTRREMAVYGIYNASPEDVAALADRSMQDENRRARAAERILDDKALSVIKTLVTIDNKEVSKEELNEIFANPKK